MIKLDNIKTKKLGKKFKNFNTINSTQEYVKEQDKLGKISEGEVVFAEKQTDGIGTHERKWYTGSQSNLAFSFVLYPNCSIKKLDTLTIVIAESLLQAVRELYLISLQMKEPNDIMFKDKKLGGILTECITEGELTKKVFIGIGFNVNETSFPRKFRRNCYISKKGVPSRFFKRRYIN